jgi:hypothetical protein
VSGLALYASDVVALARKDLRLELRARDTLPAMLLFVVATLAVFHFALPTGSGDDAAYGMLWIAIVFTALLGLARAWAPERDGGALDGLVLAPCDRSDGGGKPRPRGDPAAPLPAACDSPRRRRRRGGHLPERRYIPVLSRSLRRGLRDTCLGHVRICRHGIT